MISRQNNKLARGEQETVAGVYTYRINDKYCIEYDSEIFLLLCYIKVNYKNKIKKKREEESR